jgi:hypothetical protein
MYWGLVFDCAAIIHRYEYTIPHAPIKIIEHPTH